MILHGSELKRLIAEKHSGFVRVLRLGQRGRLESAGYLLLKKGSIHEFSLAGAASSEEAIRMIADGEDYLLDTGALEGSSGKGIALLSRLRPELQEDCE